MHVRHGNKNDGEKWWTRSCSGCEITFFPSQPSLIEGVPRSKNLSSKSWRERPKTQHLSRPRQPFLGPLAANLNFPGSCRRWSSAPFTASMVFSFLFSSIVYFSYRKSARIKKLISQKLIGSTKNIGRDTFPEPAGHFEPPSGHFIFCKRWVVAGRDQVTLVPLGWYIYSSFPCI